MPLSIEEFSSRLVASGLMTQPALTEFLSTLSDADRPADGEQLAKRLVKQKRLTVYQAQCVYGGQTKNLVLGNYVVVDKLGQGGMGVVLKAVHRRMERTVALKVLSAQSVKTPSLVERFHREVKAAAKLEHPNIVTAFDADEAGGVHFLVMQFVDGEDLSAFVRRQGPLSPSQAIEFLLQAARGLDYAHQHGVIHRDIKPANLLLSKEGAVKILDMGLARIDNPLGESQQDHSLTGTGTVMGTIDYMSPEQALNTKHADAKSDQYSLGITLHFLLTGKVAYAGDTAMEKLLAHREAPLPSLAESLSGGRKPPDDAPPGGLRPPLGELNAIFQKMIAKKPADRFASMTNVIAALTAVQSALIETPTVSFAQPVQPATTTNVDPVFQAFLQQPAGTSATKAATSAGVALATAAVAGSAAEQPTLISSGATENTATFLSRVKLRRTGRGVPRWAAIAAAVVVGIGLFGWLAAAWLNRDNTKSSIANTSMPSDQQPTAVGWHGWPPHAPKPAIAPFDDAQAKQYQEEWAEYLEVPVEWENSIGMKFRLIPPGEYLMGSTEAEVEKVLNETPSTYLGEMVESLKSESPQHKVILTRAFYLCVHETTQNEYETIIGSNPSWFSSTGRGQDSVNGKNTDQFPVETVSWDDAVDFCRRLTQKEGFLPASKSPKAIDPSPQAVAYRLPTEAEWEFACRAGTATRYLWGQQVTSEKFEPYGWANFNSGDSVPHPVEELKENPFGLFDFYGNVSEYCFDRWYDYQRFAEKMATDPAISENPESGAHILRGGHFGNYPFACSSTSRFRSGNIYDAYGFRVALSVDAVKEAMKTGWHGWPADAPKPAIAPFDAAQAKKHQEEWAAYLKVPVEHTNSIGMKFRLIPPGEFLMGNKAEPTSGEHRVILTRPFYLAAFEVTQKDYEQLSGTNPAHFAKSGAGKEVVGGNDTSNYPVETVTWNDAAALTVKMNDRESLKSHYLFAGGLWTTRDGGGYRLPTEAEWEYACRAGTTTDFWSGDNAADLSSVGWFDSNAQSRTHEVGKLEANPFGLFDIHGNVWEWLEDWWDPAFYAQFAGQPATDPAIRLQGSATHVFRGGDWFDPATSSRSWDRHARDAGYADHSIGFRLALSVDAVRQTLKVTGPDLPKPGGDPAAIDFAAERQAAEWVLSVGGTMRLQTPDGSSLLMLGDKLPAEPFVVDHVQFFGSAKIGDGDLGRLTPCQRLKSLSVMGFNERLTDACLAEIAKLHTLESLNLTALNVSDAGLRQLDSLSGLTGIELFGIKSVTDDGVERFLAQHPNLTWIAVGNASGQNRTLAPLATAQSVERLFITSDQLTPAGADVLARLPKLASLMIGIPTDESLARLKLPQLKHLELEAHFSGLAPLTAAAFDEPARFAEVASLTFRGYSGSPTDEALAAIAKLPRLRTVEMTFQEQGEPRNYTAAGVEKFRELRPDLALNVDGKVYPAAKTSGRGGPANTPPPAIAPFDAAQAKKYQEAWAAHLKVPVEYTNSLDMKFILIPPGEFTMGSAQEEVDALLNGVQGHQQEALHSETPLHKVVLTKPFYLGIHEVTQKDFESITSLNPSRFSQTGQLKDRVQGLETNTFPVETLPWHTAADFCVQLSKREDFSSAYFKAGQQITRLKGNGYRLPTEAEWEFAAHAGALRDGWQGNNPGLLNRIGWWGGNAYQRPHAVGELLENAFGLFDMNGNVAEWIEDSWEADFYKSFAGESAVDPLHDLPQSPMKGCRGGSWTDSPKFCRAAFRGYWPTTTQMETVGFRIALSVDAVRQALARRPGGNDGASRPVDLLQLAKETPDKPLPAGWSWKDGKLESDAKVETANLPLTAVPFRTYKLTAEFTLEQGGDAIYFVLPLTDGRCCLVGCNAFPQGEEFSWFGVGEVAGKSIKEDYRSGRHMRFRPKSKHAIQISVGFDPANPDLAILGIQFESQVLNFVNPARELDVSDAEYRWPDKKKLGVGTVNSAYRLYKLTLEPLPEKQQK